jgi:hypothetical protein
VTRHGFGRQHAGEKLGEVNAVAAEVTGLDLGAAGEPVREDSSQERK